MTEENEAKYQESYRIGFKRGHRRGVSDAFIALKAVLQDNNIKIDDKEFFLALEDIKDGNC